MNLNKMITSALCLGLLSVATAFADEGVPQNVVQDKAQVQQDKAAVKAERQKLRADRKKLREDRQVARKSRKERRHQKHAQEQGQPVEQTKTN